MPLIDVIIPVFNTSISYVRQALDSVMGQTLGDWQAVVVNDGSSAEYTVTLEALISSLADSRILYVKSENRGLPAARNLGIASSDAPFIAFLDSDDLSLPHRLQCQAETLMANSDIDLVHGFTDLLHDDDHAGIQRADPRDVGLNSIDTESACVHLLKRNYIAVSTVTIRRSAGDVVGFFDPAFQSIEDKEMWCRWLMYGRRFLHQPITMGVYRVHSHNMSKNAGRMRGGRMQLIAKLDALAAASAPPWFVHRWPRLRREMIWHANQEASETYLETANYRQAFLHALPWRSGVCRHASRLMAASLAGGLGLHPSA